MSAQIYKLSDYRNKPPPIAKLVGDSLALTIALIGLSFVLGFFLVSLYPRDRR